MAGRHSGDEVVSEQNKARQRQNSAPPPHSGPFQWVTLHVLEIKKIYQRTVNNVNLSVLKLEKRYLHQNGVEFHHKLIGNQFRGISRQK